jgi:gliding motility-associated-like protein
MKYIVILIIILSAQLSFSQTVAPVAGIAGVVGSANGQASASTFNNPHGIACDLNGNTYIANRYDHTIRKITAAGLVTTFAGSGSAGSNDGTGTAASFNEPWSLACDTLGNIYVADTKNYKIRKINSIGVVTTVSGNGTFGVTNGPVANAQFGFPTGIAVSKDGSVIFVCDRMTHTIRKIQSGMVSTLAGVVYSPGDIDGPAAAAKFDHPYSIALDNGGNILVTDEFNNKVRLVTQAGQVSTFAGNGTQGSTDGPALTATFNSPWGIAVDNSNNVFVGDADNFTVRKISQGTVSVYAGQIGVPGYINGSAITASFNGVSSLWYNSSDNTIYLCDPFSQLVRKIVPGTLANLTVGTQGGLVNYCAGQAVSLIASPSTLSNYIFREGSTILGNSPNGTISLSTLAPGPHNITCSATMSNGVIVSSLPITITVSAAVQVTITAQGNTTICNGDTVALTTSATGTFLWSNGSTLSSINVTTSGIYTVTVTNSQGCSGVSTPVTISTLQPPPAAITAANQTPVCYGDSVLLTAGTATAYLWSNGSTTQSTYATYGGNYTVQVTNGSGCSAIAPAVNVVFYQQSTSSISPSGNIVLVLGASATLTANSGTAFEWSTSAVSQSINVTTAGTYTVTVTDANGCSSSPATTQVSMLSSSNMVSANGPLTFCESDSVVLTSALATGNQWFRNGSIIAGAVQQNYVARLSGYYKVRYTPASGSPVFSDSVEVIVRTVTNFVVAASDTVCQGSFATINVQLQTGITFTWYNTSSSGTAVGSGLTFTTAPLSQNTSYFIEASNSFGCIRPNRFEVIAFVHPQPSSEFNSSVPAATGSAFEVFFENNSSGATAYYWDFGDPSSSTNYSSDFNPSHVYQNTGDYIISLISTNEFSCSDTLTKILSVTLNNNIYIPTGFTPNGDNNNDIFKVRGNNINAVEMHIYNQWGQKVWHAANNQDGWDGTMNGKMVANGNYAYAITVTLNNGKQEKYRGNISVIR